MSEAAVSPHDRRELGHVLILAGIQFSHLMDFVVMMPLGPSLMRELGVAPRPFALVVSVYTFSAAVSCLLASFVIDRFDRKQALAVVYAGLVAGTFLCGLAPTFAWLLGARIVTGVFGGLLQSLILTAIGSLIPEARRGRATGVVMAAFSIASVVGVPIGLWIANRCGWHATFLAIGAFSAVNWAAAAHWLPAMRGHLRPDATAAGRRAVAGVTRLLRDGATWVAIAFMASVNVIFALMPFIASFLVWHVGLAESQLPVVFLCSGLASLVFSPWSGRLSDRFGARPVFVASTLLSIPAILVFTRLGAASLAVAASLNIVVSAVGAGRMTPAMTMLNACVTARRRGAFMTLIAAVQQLSAAAASYGGGLVIGDSEAGMARFPALGLAVAVGMIVSAGLSFWLRPVDD